MSQWMETSVESFRSKGRAADMRDMILEYPPLSGNPAQTLHLRGQFIGPCIIDGHAALPVPNLRADGKPGLWMWDPRSVVLDATTRKIIYQPLDHLEGMPSWILQWLGEHPEWPPYDYRSPLVALGAL